MAKKKQWQLDAQLRRAVERGDLEHAQDLIALGASPLSDEPGGKQLLAMVDSEAMARLLVEAGADPCAVDRVGHRPGEGMKVILAGLPMFASWFTGKAEAADYLEEEARARATEQSLETTTPQVELTDEEARKRAQDQRF